MNIKLAGLTKSITFSILVVSIIRLSFLVRGNFPNPDITWNFTQIMLWFVAEANVGILCGKISQKLQLFHLHNL